MSTRGRARARQEDARGHRDDLRLLCSAGGKSVVMMECDEARIDVERMRQILADEDYPVASVV